MAAPVTYRFFTVWNLPGGVADVWAALRQPGCYPGWWPGLTAGEAVGCAGDRGTATDVVVRGLLPGALRYTLTLAWSDEPEQLGFDVTGGLIGTCRVALVGHEDGTDVLTFWDVRTAKKWPTIWGGTLRWLFSWNHNRVMLAGESGLRGWLNSRRRWAERPQPEVFAARVTVHGGLLRRPSDAPAEWRPRAA